MAVGLDVSDATPCKSTGAAPAAALQWALFHQQDRCMRIQKHSIPNFEMRSVLLLALLTLGTAAAVRAQNAPGAPIPANRATPQDLEAAFKRADVNQDGKLSRQEAERFPAVAQRFEQIDSNHDSLISLEEFSRAANS
jgi:hypothetical protein